MADAVRMWRATFSGYAGWLVMAGLRLNGEASYAYVWQARARCGPHLGPLGSLRRITCAHALLCGSRNSRLLQTRDVYWRWRSLPLRKQVRLEHCRRGLLVKPENTRRFGREADTCRRVKCNVRFWHLADKVTAPEFVSYWIIVEKSDFGPVCPLLTQSGHRASCSMWHF